MIISLFRRFESNGIFTEDESWLLFRLAAIAEAIGWTLLICGLALSRYVFPGNNIPVVIAGRVHGILFMLYALAAIALYPTLKWSRPRAAVALLASVPPYGSIIFEEWARWRYRQTQFKDFYTCLTLVLLAD